MTAARRPTTAAILVAAGRGERLGAGLPKALVELAGRALAAHALEGLRDAGLSEVVIVGPPDRLEELDAALGDGHGARLVAGGATRTDSVRAGLAALADDVDLVAVHDAARALMPPATIAVALAAVHGDVVAAAPAVAMADTVKEIAGGGAPAGARDDAERVVATLPRDRLRAVQTPQVFTREALAGALAGEGTATDDLALVEARIARGEQDGRVVLVAGSTRGLKITRRDDVVMAEALLAAAADS